MNAATNTNAGSRGRRQRLTTLDHGLVIGRERDVRVVQHAVGDGVSCLLLAPPGMGKTTVLEAAVAASGRPWRYGAASDLLRSQPLLPVVRAVGRFPQEGDAEGIAADVCGSLEDGELLVLDDLQWADPTTIDVLPALARTGRVLMAARPDNAITDQVVTAVHGCCRVFSLEPLEDEDAEALVRAHWAAGPAAACEAIVARSGGNALCLELLSRNRGWVATGPNALVAFIESLSADARSSLARLGASGSTLTVDDAGVSELVEHHVVALAADGTVALKSEYVGELAVALLGEADRMALHRELAASTTDPVASAYHWSRSGDAERTYTSALAAVERTTTDSVRASLLALAAEHAAPTDRWRVTNEAVAALAKVGQIETCDHLLEALDGIDPPTLTDRCNLAIVKAWLALRRRDFTAALDLTDAALALDDVPALQRIWLLSLRASGRAACLDLISARVDAERAIALAATTDPPTSVAGAELVLAVARFLGGEEGWREDALGAIARIDDVSADTAFEMMSFAAIMLFFAGDADGAVEVCDAVQARADQLNNRSWRQWIRAIKAINLAFMRPGDEAVVAELRDLVDDPSTGRYLPHSVAVLAVATADRGDPDAALGLLERAAEPHAASGNEGDLMVAWARAEIASLTRRWSECAQWASIVAESVFPLLVVRPVAAVLQRWAALAQGATEDELMAIPEPMVVFPGFGGTLVEARGVASLARPVGDQDAKLLLDAADQHQQYLRRNALRCRLVAAKVLGSQGRTDEALALLQQLADDCASRDLQAWRRLVHASMRDLGLRPTVRGPNRGEGITDRQREILLLVGAGLSSREIAARMNIRVSSVDTHIRNAVRRLGVSGRREAALRVMGES